MKNDMAALMKQVDTLMANNNQLSHKNRVLEDKLTELNVRLTMRDKPSPVSTPISASTPAGTPYAKVSPRQHQQQLTLIDSLRQQVKQLESQLEVTQHRLQSMAASATPAPSLATNQSTDSCRRCKGFENQITHMQQYCHIPGIFNSGDIATPTELGAQLSTAHANLNAVKIKSFNQVAMTAYFEKTFKTPVLYTKPNSVHVYCKRAIIAHVVFLTFEREFLNPSRGTTYVAQDYSQQGRHALGQHYRQVQRMSTAELLQQQPEFKAWVQYVLDELTTIFQFSDDYKQQLAVSSLLTFLKTVWLLHILSHAFMQAPLIIRRVSGDPYDSETCVVLDATPDDSDDEDEKNPMLKNSRISFMVWPGMWLDNSVLGHANVVLKE
jgi:hypothetical protein